MVVFIETTLFDLPCKHPNKRIQLLLPVGNGSREIKIKAKKREAELYRRLRVSVNLYKPVGCNLEGVGLSESLGLNGTGELIKMKPFGDFE